MTDETKQLFDAPWTEGYDSDTGETWITDKNGRRVADTSRHGMRIARLPELYDALADVMYEGCVNCCSAHDPKFNGTFDRFLDDGCPLNQTDCPFGRHWSVLRKVRDGK